MGPILSQSNVYQIYFELANNLKIGVQIFEGLLYCQNAQKKGLIETFLLSTHKYV